jgi:trehalose 6-phosphate synthase
MFLRLPWREQLLDGLLDFDVLGFQSERDRGNFLQCVTAISPRSTIGGSGTIRVAAESEGDAPRSVRVGSFPIGIDDRAFRGLAESDEVRERAARLREELGGGTILLGVDRLDYTKGLLHKLRGYRTALKRYRGLREKVRLVQHVVPSREAVPQYRRLRPEVERLVGEINGEFGTPGWTPVRYFYHALERKELVAYYRLADVLLVTSLKDGMNLVAKEYCASNVDERGVLVLSEFTGAAAQLGADALLVNPYDSEGLARGIREAVSMAPARRRARMSRLRRVVGEADVYRWVQTYLDAVRREPRPPAQRADGPRAAYYA